jgi:hypothetical protein
MKAQCRHARAAQQAIAAGEKGEGLARKRLAAAKVACDELDRVPARFLEDLRGLRGLVYMVVHGPFGQQVRDHRSAADARLVLGHETVVRDDVREQVGRVPERQRAIVVAARHCGNAPQRGPAMRSREHRRTHEEAAHDRQVGQAGARENQARQARRRSAQLRVGERDAGKRVVGEVEMRLQPPRERIGGEQRERQQSGEQANGHK